MRSRKYTFFFYKICLNLIIFLIIAGVMAFFYLGIIKNLHIFYKHNYAVSDEMWDYFIGVAFAFFITGMLIILPLKWRKWVLLAWSIKLFIIFIFDFFYESHYSFLDAYGNYYASIVKYPVYKLYAFSALPHNVNVILSYLFLLFPHSYRLSVVFSSFVGLIGTYFFLLGIKQCIKEIDKFALILVLFFPSILFWTHILGKDPIIFFFIGGYIYGLGRFISGKFNFSTYLMLTISFLGFIYFKFWLVGIFGSSLWLSLLFLPSISKRKKLVIFICLGVGVIFLINKILNRFGVISLKGYISYMLRISQSWMHGGSAVVLKLSSPKEFILYLPYMMLTTLFRPFVFEMRNLFQLLNAIENIFLLGICLYMLIKIIKYKLIKYPVIDILLIHIFVWLFVYSPVCFQNLGTSSRYRIQVLPFILLLFLIIRKLTCVKQ